MGTGTGTPPLPTQRIVSPHLPNARPKKSKRSQLQLQQQEYNNNNPSPPTLNAKVPPISVLIVEDNPINLKLLEAFVKRLRVRWQTAMNGREAVKKWRSGGFHLVLMDIQLPGMNGLEATREIRRLERINDIGVFSNTPAEDTLPEIEEIAEQDRQEGLARFKSPVIIVALTASSLQSDRHEALAAGCNDFLTKVCIPLSRHNPFKK
jgi:osomolarity two-component system response regulator SSK1